MKTTSAIDYEYFLFCYREKYLSSLFTLDVCEDYLYARIVMEQNERANDEDHVGLEREGTSLELEESMESNVDLISVSDPLRLNTLNNEGEVGRGLVLRFPPCLSVVRSCNVKSSPTHQPGGFSWVFLSGLTKWTGLFRGNGKSRFAQAEEPPDSIVSKCSLSRRKMQGQSMEASPVSAGRGSRTILCSNLRYTLLPLLIMMLAFPAASCHGCASSGWSHDLSYCDPCWFCRTPAVTPAATVLRFSNTSDGTCSQDVLRDSLAELCHSPICLVEDDHWPSSSLVGCFSPVQQLTDHHWPGVQSVLWHAPVKWNEEHFNQSGICCSQCLYHLETCDLLFLQPPDTAFLLGSEMRPEISPAQSHTAETPPTSSCLLLVNPPFIAPVVRNFFRRRGNSSRLELLVRCYWFLTNMRFPCAAHRTETHRQGMNRPSRMESGEACPLVSLELPLVLHSLALLFVYLMIDKRYPLVDAEVGEEPGELEPEQVGGSEPEAEREQLEPDGMKPAGIGPRVGVQPETDPLPSNTLHVYQEAPSSGNVMFLLDRRQSSSWPCPHDQRDTDEPLEDTDDTDTYSSNFAPPGAITLVDAPLSTAATTIPTRMNHRTVEMLPEHKPSCTTASVVVPSTQYMPPVAGKHQLCHQGSPQLHLSLEDKSDGRRRLSGDSHEACSNGKERRYHSQDDDSSASDEDSQATTSKPSKVSWDGHKGATSLCKIMVGEESGSALHGISPLPVTGVSSSAPHAASDILSQYSPNPPPNPYGVCIPTCTLDVVVMDVDTAVSFLDDHGLGVHGCNMGPATIAEDIELVPYAGPLHNPPVEEVKVEGGIFNCPFDHMDLLVRPFR